MRPVAPEVRVRASRIVIFGLGFEEGEVRMRWAIEAAVMPEPMRTMSVLDGRVED